MAEATCRRELDLEIPADEVTKALERVAKEFARVARVPGFRPGKAPVSLIRRRFADDIKGEVVQSLVPERVEKAVTEQKRAAQNKIADMVRGRETQIQGHTDHRHPKVMRFDGLFAKILSQ